MRHVTKSPKETQKLGHFILNEVNIEKYKHALVFALEGDLGAGKTTFVQGLAKILGVKAKIKSPTFTIIKGYKLNQRNHKFLYHLDCYRLKDHKDLIVLGIKDLIKNKENILLIEWPERVKKILPKKHLKIKFSHINKNTRKIEII